MPPKIKDVLADFKLADCLGNFMEAGKTKMGTRVLRNINFNIFEGIALELI